MNLTQEQKEKRQQLFATIMAEIEDKCQDCPFCDGLKCLDLSCRVSDEAMTAILSLDKKENYPDVIFPKERENAETLIAM